MRQITKLSSISILLLVCLVVSCTREPSKTSEESASGKVVQEENDAIVQKEVTGVVQDPTSSMEQEDAAEVAEEDSFAVDKTNPDWKQTLQQPGIMIFEEGKRYFWDMQTNKGAMSFELFHKSAPMHVSSTIYLTELGFYDATVFHRVMPGFMAQGGDPTGTGRGGPGYHYEGEFNAAIRHDKPGILSMANAGPGTDGSQFFITFAATKHLNGKHTIFGEISKGMDTLQALEKSGSSSGRTSEKLEIIKASIRIE